MSSENSSVKILKVQPYPFDITIAVEKSGQSGTVAVLKLVLKGCLLDVKSLIVKVGDKLVMQVTLPAEHGSFVAEGRVVKTYDHFKGSQSGTAAQRIAEIHFLRQPLPEMDRLKVKAFLSAIKQSGILPK